MTQRPGRTAVYIVCSPRPRVGKTLLARLLVEYLRARHGRVLAFDLSASEPSLIDYHPKLTETADIGDTFGQMALMDRLIVSDGVPKVLDIGATAFEGFFNMCEQIGFVREARRQNIDPVLLFMLDKDRASARGYAMLRRMFPKPALIAVNNDSVLYGEVPGWASGERKLDIRLLPDFLKGYIGKIDFSFGAFARNKSNQSSELYHWIGDIFLRFREIELQLMLR